MSKIKSDGKIFRKKLLKIVFLFGHFKYVQWTKLQAPVVAVTQHGNDKTFDLFTFTFVKDCIEIRRPESVFVRMM